MEGELFSIRGLEEGGFYPRVGRLQKSAKGDLGNQGLRQSISQCFLQGGPGPEQAENAG